jgi:hypothetical protein
MERNQNLTETCKEKAVHGWSRMKQSWLGTFRKSAYLFKNENLADGCRNELQGADGKQRRNQL